MSGGLWQWALLFLDLYSEGLLWLLPVNNRLWHQPVVKNLTRSYLMSVFWSDSTVNWSILPESPSLLSLSLLSESPVRMLTGQSHLFVPSPVDSPVAWLLLVCWTLNEVRGQRLMWSLSPPVCVFPSLLVSPLLLSLSAPVCVCTCV